jgi:hypothetical protein
MSFQFSVLSRELLVFSFWFSVGAGEPAACLWYRPSSGYAS